MDNKIILVMTGISSAACQIAIPFAVQSAYNERGYFAIGGEYGLIALSLGCLCIAFNSINRILKDFEKNK